MRTKKRTSLTQRVQCLTYVLAAILLCNVTVPAEAGIWGNISGTVSDENGQPLVGATVKLIGTTRGGFSAGDGRYIIRRVPTGSYTLAVTYVSKKAECREDVLVEADRSVVVNVTMSDDHLVRHPLQNYKSQRPAPVQLQQWLEAASVDGRINAGYTNLPLFPKANSIKLQGMQKRQTADAPLSMSVPLCDDNSWAKFAFHARAGRDSLLNDLRIEELVNAFDYQFEASADRDFTIVNELIVCPWDRRHHLLQVAVCAREKPQNAVPVKRTVHLVIDVSGSMIDSDGHELLRRVLPEFVDSLPPNVTAVIHYLMDDRIQTVTEVLDNSHAPLVRSLLSNMQFDPKVESFVSAGLAKHAEKLFSQAAGSKERQHCFVLFGDGNVNLRLPTEMCRKAPITYKMREINGRLDIVSLNVGSYGRYILPALARKFGGRHSFVQQDYELRSMLQSLVLAPPKPLATNVRVFFDFNPHLVTFYRQIGHAAGEYDAWHYAKPELQSAAIQYGEQFVFQFELQLKQNDVPAASVFVENCMTDRARESKELAFIELRYDGMSGNTATEKQAVKPNFSVVDNIGPDFRLAASLACIGLSLSSSAESIYQHADMYQVAQSLIGDDISSGQPFKSRREEYAFILAHYLR